MPTAYLAISLSNRPRFDAEVKAIRQCFQTFDWELLVFVDTYNFSPEEEKTMMQTAFSDLDQCDLLIAEVSKKAIGVGVEVGYAVGKGKPIIYLKRKQASYSTTVGGSADHFIEYENSVELALKLKETLTTIL